MKLTLEFKLPEEDEEFYYANNGLNYYSVCHELDQYLRSKVKYEPLTEKQDDIYQEIRNKLYDLIQNNNVKL